MKFHNSFYVVGNLFVAAGNAEFCNKMASCMADQKVFVIKTVYSSGGFFFAVAR
jgi:hypothetical protein